MVYRVLLCLAGGMLGMGLTAIPHRFFMEHTGFGDDASWWIAPCVGLCCGLLIGKLTYSSVWFHRGSVLLGPLAIALSIWKSLDLFAESNKLTGTGPLAGFGEWLGGILCLLLATGFLLLVGACGTRLFAIRRNHRRPL
jgi:hypothetical protein